MSSGQIVQSFSEKVTLNLSHKRAGIDIIDTNARRYFLPVSSVLEVQILPAAAVSFSGTILDLWELLVNDFFDELHHIVNVAGATDYARCEQVLNWIFNHLNWGITL